MSMKNFPNDTIGNRTPTFRFVAQWLKPTATPRVPEGNSIGTILVLPTVWTLWESGGIDPNILNLGIRWRFMVSFTIHAL